MKRAVQNVQRVSDVRRHMPKGRDDRVISFLAYTLVTLLALTILYPILNIVSVSFSSYSTYIRNPTMVFPSELDLSAYRIAMGSSLLLKSYLNTVVITVIGTSLTLIMCTLYAYPLSRPMLRCKPFFHVLILIPMMFSGGIIPSFLLMRELGLLNTLSSQYLPVILGAYNVILLTSFFRTIPDELLEAAVMDGANEPYLLSRIVVPLSKPILATIALFAAVGLWNQYFSAVIYVRTQDKWPVQLVLREIILASNTAALAADGNMAEMSSAVPVEQLRYATLIVVMLPVMCVYPFLQKYFTGGIMLGAVKG